MFDQTAQLRGAFRIDAARHDFAFRALDIAAANRTFGGKLENLFASRALFNQHAHHFGNDFASFANHNFVADANVFATHFVFVVQRRFGNRRARDNGWFKSRQRS